VTRQCGDLRGLMEEPVSVADLTTKAGLMRHSHFRGI